MVKREWEWMQKEVGVMRAIALMIAEHKFM